MNRVCAISDCGRPVIGRGYCGMHYQRWAKHGDPLVRFHYWPPEMIAKLEQGIEAGWSDAAIGRHLGRSASAVKKARMRLGIAARYRQAMTAREVSRRMGVNVMTVLRWLESGSLKGRRRGARYGRFVVWQVTDDDLLAFIDDPACWCCYDPHVIADDVLRDWAIELRGHVTYLTIKEAASRLGVGYMAVWHWVDRGVLPGGRDGGLVWVDARAVEARVAKIAA